MAFDLESEQGKFIISRHENDHGPRIDPHGIKYLESVQLRHLHVDKNQIGSKRLDLAHGIPARRRSPEDFDVSVRFQQQPYSATRGRLIIDNQLLNFFLFIIHKGVAPIGLGRKGIAKLTVIPFPHLLFKTSW